MIKVVLDTNVVVSAYLVPGGKPAQILSLAKASEISIFLSPQIIEEIRETLLRPKLTKIHKATPKEIDQFIIAFEKATTITQGAKRVYAVNSDPDDNKILACALEGQADYIVSGDHHLTDLKSFQGIPIVNPDEFLQTIQGRYS